MLDFKGVNKKHQSDGNDSFRDRTVHHKMKPTQEMRPIFKKECHCSFFSNVKQIKGSEKVCSAYFPPLHDTIISFFWHTLLTCHPEHRQTGKMYSDVGVNCERWLLGYSYKSTDVNRWGGDTQNRWSILNNYPSNQRWDVCEESHETRTTEWLTLNFFFISFSLFSFSFCSFFSRSRRCFSLFRASFSSWWSGLERSFLTDAVL